jgi:hypothetical protein
VRSVDEMVEEGRREGEKERSYQFTFITAAFGGSKQASCSCPPAVRI